MIQLTVCIDSICRSRPLAVIDTSPGLSDPATSIYTDRQCKTRAMYLARHLYQILRISTEPSRGIRKRPSRSYLPQPSTVTSIRSRRRSSRCSDVRPATRTSTSSSNDMGQASSLRHSRTRYHTPRGRCRNGWLLGSSTSSLRLRSPSSRRSVTSSSTWKNTIRTSKRYGTFVNSHRRIREIR